MPAGGSACRTLIIVYATYLLTSQYINDVGATRSMSPFSKMLIALSPTGYALLSLIVTVSFGTVLWRLLSYVRLRVALLAVSKIPGPPSESFWSGTLVFGPYFGKTDVVWMKVT